MQSSARAAWRPDTIQCKCCMTAWYNPVQVLHDSLIQSSASAAWQPDAIGLTLEQLTLQRDTAMPESCLPHRTLTSAAMISASSSGETRWFLPGLLLIPDDFCQVFWWDQMISARSSGETGWFLPGLLVRPGDFCKVFWWGRMISGRNSMPMIIHLKVIYTITECWIRNLVKPGHA